MSEADDPIWEWRVWRDGVRLASEGTLPPNESMIAATISGLDERLREYAEARSRQLGLRQPVVRNLALVTLWSDLESHCHEMALRYATESLDEDASTEWIMEAAGTHIGEESRQEWTDDVTRYQNRLN